MIAPTGTIGGDVDIDNLSKRVGIFGHISFWFISVGLEIFLTLEESENSMLSTSSCLKHSLDPALGFGKPVDIRCRSGVRQFLLPSV